MLGSEVRRSLAAHGTEHTVVGRDDLDLLDPGAVSDAVSGHDVVVNCAAWTAVDLAETYEPHAFEINATAAGVLGRFGPLAAPAVENLREAVNDPDPEVRRIASDALLRVQPPGK